ncbi:MAG: hypothetical protein ABH878_00895, partial [bacterium]
MRYRELVSVFVVLALIMFGAQIASAFSSGPPDNRAGNPPGMFDCTGCHNSFPVNSGAGIIQAFGVPSFYIPGETYTIYIK